MYLNSSDVLNAIIPRAKMELKSPASAVFCSPEELMIVPIHGSQYKVLGHVDSQNSYGAMLRTNFEYHIAVRESDGHISVMSGGVGSNTPTAVKAKEDETFANNIITIIATVGFITYVLYVIFTS